MNRLNSTSVDGLLRDNTVLSAGMIISPVIMCGNNIQNALALIYVFSTITLLSVFIASFIPKKLPYAIKIIAYAVISSFVYIPIKVLSAEIYPDSIENIGIYFPLIAVNSLIVYQTEVKFFKLSRRDMLTSLVFYILGFDAVILITAFIREIIGSGTINSNIVDMDFIISGVSQPFGGFILIGLMCGIYRKIRAS
ncbi:MAG: electron transport complex subunit E, partial [Clostridia bacterium]|nr:electron transport complex subunit E [Clostridia bacterium]